MTNIIINENKKSIFIFEIKCGLYVDLNVDLKIVMMSSGKIIKYDQLLLASDNTNSHQLEDHAPIDRRAISLLCNLNKKHNISVGIKNKYDMERYDTNASSIKDGENLKLQNILFSHLMKAASFRGRNQMSLFT